MLRDVFYYGNKPNVHPREKFAKDLADARRQASTEHFWIINEFCDYTDFDWDFDFDFLPDEDVWTQEHNNVWPSQHQKDSGTWLCSQKFSEVIVYRNDVVPVKRKNIKNDLWKTLDDIDESRFDFSWHPDPSDPPYIYRWGCAYYPVEIKHVLEYVVKGAKNVKYMTATVPLKPQYNRWKIYTNIDKTKFDFSWRPDPREPEFIYVWGNKYVEGKLEPTIEYYCDNATEKKYVNNLVEVLPCFDNWEMLENIETSKFDFAWRPDPTSPPYIYAWGNQWNKPEDKISVQYVVPGATEYKYMTERSKRKHCMDNWVIPENIDTTGFDFSWEPSPAEPPYIYQFGTQWQKDGGPKYVVEGATEIKYIEFQKAKALPTTDNWTVPSNVDVTGFDFSWHPDEISPPYIYVFATQWALTGGPVYTVSGATEKKYIDEPSAIALPDKTNWIVPEDIDIDSFDFSWHPFAEDDPCIYQIGTQWQKTGGPRYITPGTDEMSPIKYIDRRIIKAVKKNNKNKFVVLNDYKIKDFDWSWHPDDTEEPYIYVFGNTQYPPEVMPTIEYRVENATQIKYIHDVVATLDNDFTNWLIPDNIDVESFDFSWKPDPNDPPYIYEFPTQWNNRGGPKYVIPGATEYKYIDSPIATVKSDKSKWFIPENIDDTGFDYSWVPHPDDPPFIYQFGTQWQKTGGPRYSVRGAKEFKYVDTFKVKALPIKDHKNWVIPTNLDISEFDFSWHPDETNPPYIYQFGTQWAMSGGPRYIVEGAKEVRYEDNPVAKAAVNMKNWEIPDDIDVDKFDFSWHPYAEDQPFIYQFGTQHQKTGGPRYITPGTDEMSPIKYIDTRILKATKLPNKSKFDILDNHVIKDFDYSWHPDDTEQPYIYVFGNDKYPAEIMPTLTYVVHGATQKKYVKDKIAILDQNKRNWTIPENIDSESFDFSWVPNPKDPPYIYEFATIWNDRGGPIYTVEGATEKKYIEDIKAKTLPNKKYWKINLPIEEDIFDFSWTPHPEAPAYIYVFGNQWNSAEKESTIEYRVPGATEKKYVKDIIATVKQNKNKFKILYPIIEDSFDFSWRPDPFDDPYIYVFGNQHHTAEKMPTIKYAVKGATESKYVNDLKAELAPNLDNWKILIPVDKTKFDFSWVPDPYDPPYIYVWGNQWNDATIEPTVEYYVQGATEKKYMTESVAHVLPQPDKFEVLFDVYDFDFSWRPNPKDPPYIYVFGNQWNSAEKEPTIRYRVKDSIDFKYINEIVADVKEDLSLWEIPEGFDVDSFDFTWRPDPFDPAYIYEFATEYADRGGPRYKTAGATDVKYMSHIKAKLRAKAVPKYYIETTLDKLISEHKDEVFWALQKSINYDNFDFNWRPTKDQEQYVHVFGSPEAEKTQTYFINANLYLQGFTNKNFVEQDKKASEEYLAELFVQPDIFLVDRGNPETQERFEQLKTRFTNVSKTRFLNSWVDTINRCINRSNTEVCWILNSELDYSNFDFKYYPNPWQMKMVHVFGTQWSHWGTTFMVNRDTFAEDTKYVKIIEHLNNLNFVKERRAIATSNLYDIIVINHGNKECEKVVASLEARACGKKVSTVDYEISYLNTIKKIVTEISAKKEHFVWITSSVCSYGEFDFTYICDPFAKDSLHVFPSDRQKFGDTFLLDVNKAKDFIDSMEMLQQYPKVNYNQTIRAKRLTAPVITTSHDSHVEAIQTDFDFPYAIFQTEEIATKDNEPMSLWDEKTKNILITSTGATRIIVPKEALSYVKNEIYDYPYIKTANKLIDSMPLDIVFLSNGEQCAEKNYEHLLAVTKGLKNRIIRVDGVNGRVEAYHAALKASKTAWAFTVFAKLKVDSKFDWSWQPDRLQVPKHYIFHAKNPVNGLEYGHQGMIAYNKKLTLNNFGEGLDFTLDDPHETVEILSGTATFNTDPYSTWRTAFREVIKLKSDYTDISQDRLKVWLTKAKGKFANDCLQGANDAVEYYDNVSGDIDQLKLSYEWNWLKEYYNKKYK